MNQFTEIISHQLQLPAVGVDNTLQLLAEGCTIPFIARYRKERTGALDEVQIGSIAEQKTRLDELQKRKTTIIKTITELGKLTPELSQKIEQTWDATALEDLYLPYKPKRRTRAQIAREQGLEPLAQMILMQRERNIDVAAKRFVKGDISDEDAAIIGAQDIIAETISENEQSRNTLRGLFRRTAQITSKVVKTKSSEEEAQKFSDYFDFSEPLRRCSGNRLLAMRRGEKAGYLRVRITIDEDEAIERLQRQYARGNGRCTDLVNEAVEDACKRLLLPSIENEWDNLSREKAEEEAISVFASNLRQLLLAAPLGQKRVMGVDPGIRTGCKVVALDAQGNLLYHDVAYPFPPKGTREKAVRIFSSIAKKYDIEAVAVGNGTASRETSDILREVFADTSVDVFTVSEDGASVYSASKTAREEFPDEDVTVRGAVSIGRRLMDPLAELVKIDPKSIGVGQYQHDVDQTKLKHSLDLTVESCVNNVGVNLNTASKHLLTYVSGLGLSLAQNIVDYRRENGAFTSRQQLKKVPRLGPSAYEQCAGFLRIPGAKNPLDNSAVHPESYDVVKLMAKDNGCTVGELIVNKDILKAIDLKRYVTDTIGMPTLQDILKELEKPGLDPRGEVETFDFDHRVHTIGDLEVGMILPGIVTNLTKFGAFVDIGVHQDGLVHISQITNRFISDPSEALTLHQHVMVRVTDVDLIRKRIGLSMKGI